MEEVAQAFTNVVGRIRSLEASDAPAASYNNLLRDGSFEDWALGNGPITYTPSTFRVTPYWNLWTNGSSVISAQRDTINADIGSDSCIRLDVSTLQSGGLGAIIYQDLNPQHLRGRYLSLSGRVKADISNIVYLSIKKYHGPNPDTYDDSTPYTGSTEYETLAVTTFIEPTVTAIQIFIWTYSLGVLYADNVMLVVGSSPVEYVPPITTFHNDIRGLIRCRLDKVNAQAYNGVWETIASLNHVRWDTNSMAEPPGIRIRTPGYYSIEAKFPFEAIVDANNSAAYIALIRGGATLYLTWDNLQTPANGGEVYISTAAKFELLQNDLIQLRIWSSHIRGTKNGNDIGYNDNSWYIDGHLEVTRLGD